MGTSQPSQTPLSDGKIGHSLRRDKAALTGGRLSDPNIRAQFSQLIGRDAWRDDFVEGVPNGENLRRLLEESLKESCGFKFVSATCIDKTLANRPHFYLVHCTHSFAGLSAYRETEHRALAVYEEKREVARADARKARIDKRDEAVGQGSLFGDQDDVGHHVETAGSSFANFVEDQKYDCREWLLKQIPTWRKRVTFQELCELAMPQFSVRETHLKDICVELAGEGIIANSWKARNSKARKPSLKDEIGPSSI